MITQVINSVTLRFSLHLPIHFSSRRFFLARVYLALPLTVTPSDFCQGLCRQKANVTRLWR